MSSRISAVSPRRRFAGQVVRQDWPVQPRPPLDGWHVFATGDGRSVAVAPGVMALLETVERDHAPLETGGLLFGRCYRDGAGSYVLVTHAQVPELAGEVEETPATVRITADGAIAMVARARRAEPLADQVGWWHTHPSFEAYFSSVDLAEQARWVSPLSVGLVLSGLAAADPRHAVFVGPESEPTERELDDEDDPQHELPEPDGIPAEDQVAFEVSTREPPVHVAKAAPQTALTALLAAVLVLAAILIGLLILSAAASIGSVSPEVTLR